MYSFRDLVKEAFQKWQRDKASRLSASLAYYTLVSIAPLLVIVVAIAGVVFGEQAAKGQLVARVQDFVGGPGAQVLQNLLSRAHRPAAGLVAGLVSGVVLVFGASGVFAELQDSLNQVWDVPQKPWRGILTFLKERFVPFLLILGIGLLLLISVVLSAVLEAVTKYLGNVLPIPAFVLHVMNIGVSFVVATLLFAMIYKFLPDREIPWSDVWIGAAVTSVLFTIGKTLIGRYLGHASVGSPYGAAGSLAAFVVWVYYSAQIFFFGAEFTRVYSRRRGSRVADRTMTA